MQEFKINMNEGKVVKISSSTASVRLVLEDDGIHGHFTDVHCDSNELHAICKLVEMLGIQLGTQPAQQEHSGLPFPLDMILR